jgi:hypothetical protein
MTPPIDTAVTDTYLTGKEKGKFRHGWQKCQKKLDTAYRLPPTGKQQDKFGSGAKQIVSETTW